LKRWVRAISTSSLCPAKTPMAEGLRFLYMLLLSVPLAVAPSVGAPASVPNSPARRCPLSRSYESDQPAAPPHGWVRSERCRIAGLSNARTAPFVRQTFTSFHFSRYWFSRLSRALLSFCRLARTGTWRKLGRCLALHAAAAK